MIEYFTKRTINDRYSKIWYLTLGSSLLRIIIIAHRCIILNSSFKFSMLSSISHPCRSRCSVASGWCDRNDPRWSHHREIQNVLQPDRPSHVPSISPRLRLHLCAAGHVQDDVIRRNKYSIYWQQQQQQQVNSNLESRRNWLSWKLRQQGAAVDGR